MSSSQAIVQHTTNQAGRILPALLLLLGSVAATSGSGCAPAASRDSCHVVRQAVHGHVRDACLLYRAAGAYLKLSPFIRLRYSHVTITWRYRCLRSFADDHISIAVDEYRGTPFHGGQEISNREIVDVPGGKSAHGTKRLAVGRADRLALSINASSFLGPARCTWHIELTGDTYA